MVIELASLDLYSILVDFVFGSFLFAVIGIIILLFIIMLLGRVSIYTASWYLVLFVVAMTLGYGYVTLDIIVFSIIIIMFIMSVINWMSSWR